MKLKKTNTIGYKGIGEKAISVVFLVVVVSVSFFLGYMAGSSRTSPNSIQKNPLRKESLSIAPVKKEFSILRKKSATVAVQPIEKQVKQKKSSKKQALRKQLKITTPSQNESITSRNTFKSSSHKPLVKKARKYYYSIQVGAFKFKAEALALVKRLKAKGYAVRVLPPSDKAKYYRVRVGIYETKSSADTVALKLARTEKLKPLVIRESRDG